MTHEAKVKIPIEEMNVEFSPVSEVLTKEVSEDPFLLLGREGDLGSALVEDPVFVPRFETDEFPRFENLLYEYSGPVD
jgi:hypothetical protein